MVKLYNTQANLASDLSIFFKNVVPNISKPHLKIVPYIILGMVQSESVVTPDIVKTFKGDFSFVNPFSSIRRLERFSITLTLMYIIFMMLLLNMLFLTTN